METSVVGRDPVNEWGHSMHNRTRELEKVRLPELTRKLNDEHRI